ncbi:hypothetical protein E0H86_06590 [Acinetobacter sp. ANC 4635]|uniref:hypothetical protein n=1 Tax=Acinetobacter sp. ANC 4635 TaxID=2529846 RepID=UPI00103D8E6A|nr:hypothetical protein [Acinetobacter sp. ANC 4635]TCB32080.1 hypothetical protein E0H86_06590 [Acinetobacter sp. ANC 4635]
MKPLLIVCLCLSSWTLFACKPNHINSQQIHFSHNQATDIKIDLGILQNLAQRQNQESSVFQQQALHTIRSGNAAQIEQIIQSMQQRVTKFNYELQDLLLSSAEVDTIRQKMMHNNQLSLELAQLGAAQRPDTLKILQLQKKLEQNQQEIIQLTHRAQSKISKMTSAS